jgi:hypothetical protein
VMNELGCYDAVASCVHASHSSGLLRRTAS